ncbi:MAG: helix-turn-helix transcriptional regulator [Clostridiaceae bacterium]
MKKNEYVSLEVLEKICNYLNCSLTDVVEFIDKEKAED